MNAPLTSENLATWWKVEGRSTKRIEPVKVISCTDKTVTLAATTQYRREHRANRHSEWNSYFPTWTEARAFALAEAERDLEIARLQLQQAQAHHGNVKGWKCPEGTW